MLTRQVYLESRTTLANSGEKTVDINVTDPITALWVEFRCANGATSNIDNWMAECVSAIEVIDGSDVLFSLDGQEALALACYNLGQMPDQLVYEVPDNVQNLAVPIMFGRYFGDQELSFNPKKFVNPQLRIKWNLATNQAVGATGFATGGLKLTVLAHVMEGATAPRGYLMAKEHYTWTTASSGVEYVDLPTNYPYRGLLVRGDKAATGLYGVLSHLKLDCDVGKYIPFDMRMTDLMRSASMLQPTLNYRHEFLVSDDTTIYFLVKAEEQVAFAASNIDDTVFRYVNAGIGEGKLYMDSAGSAETDDKYVDAIVQGRNPFRTLYVPFGDPLKPTEWFPATRFSSVRLEATQASASGTGYICLVQERLY